MLNTRLLVLSLLAAVLTAYAVQAGTLDDAPFRFAPPTKDWKIDDANLRQIGPGSYIAAMLSNSNLNLTVAILKTEMDSQTNAFDEFCGGARNSLSRSHIKVLLDEPTTFLNFKARRFAYELPRPGGFTNYNETVVFATPTTAWTISTIGLQNKTNDVRHAFQLFQKK